MEIIEEYISINNINEFKYNYRLTKSIYNGIIGYGIEIQKQDCTDSQDMELQKDGVRLISVHRHKVKKILMKLYNNQVSPIHLIDVIGSYVDEHVYEFDVGMQSMAIN
ncbi:DUF6514 family protein [Clostridium uliginosum]|uniref:Uncharacterized protein n=1 Tax=Clostridium uliginosum TaxID=119641 RepID=A0A1I1QGW0_9CLOT|nr:DUF6514 family protein [Clostridium uliginosum]SFD21232.1 hypothetical protein SAMN05421842_1253 [Clostridium uliginosum]